jgi:hypothetical protein
MIIFLGRTFGVNRCAAFGLKSAFDAFLGQRLMKQGLFDLSGRVAVVVGGTTGLGRAIALDLA